MAEILGLGTTDQPYMRIGDEALSNPLKGALKSDRLTDAEKDPASWPAPMREQWGDDQGRKAGAAARERQVAQFRKLTAALDAFKPDLILIWSKDGRESLKDFAVPHFWVQAHDSVDYKPYQSLGRKENVFGIDGETVVSLPGHPDGAKHLVNELARAGFDPTYSLQAMHPNGLAHTFTGVTVHLDWDRRRLTTPIVPLSVDPFGLRQRGQDGMSPIVAGDPKPISPRRAFELGRVTARAFRESPWRVALVAGTGWSHANNTSWERHWLHPDVEADRRRHEQWARGGFTSWADFTYEELEEYGQWELLCWIMLAGAMTEIGAGIEYSDFQEGWIFNSNWVNTIFSVA